MREERRNVGLKLKDHKQLKEVAEKNNRTIVGQIIHWIKKELKK